MSVPLPDPLAGSGANSPETDPLALDLAELHASNDSSNCSSAAGGSSSTSTATKPLITPIRLKLARSSSGGGYVMTSKGKREQQQICDETKTLNIVLPKLDIPLDTGTIDLSAATTAAGEKSLVFPSAGPSELQTGDGAAASAISASAFSSSTTTPPPPTMSFNSLAASSGTNLFNPFGGSGGDGDLTAAMSDQSSQQQQQQQQSDLAAAGGKDCEVR